MNNRLHRRYSVPENSEHPIQPLRHFSSYDTVNFFSSNRDALLFESKRYEKLIQLLNAELPKDHCYDLNELAMLLSRRFSTPHRARNILRGKIKKGVMRAQNIFTEQCNHLYETCKEDIAQRSTLGYGAQLLTTVLYCMIYEQMEDEILEHTRSKLYQTQISTISHFCSLAEEQKNVQNKAQYDVLTKFSPLGLEAADLNEKFNHEYHVITFQYLLYRQRNFFSRPAHKAIKESLKVIQDLNNPSSGNLEAIFKKIHEHDANHLTNDHQRRVFMELYVETDGQFSLPAFNQALGNMVERRVVLNSYRINPHWFNSAMHVDGLKTLVLEQKIVDPDRALKRLYQAHCEAWKKVNDVQNANIVLRKREQTLGQNNARPRGVLDFFFRPQVTVVRHQSGHANKKTEMGLFHKFFTQHLKNKTQDQSMHRKDAAKSAPRLSMNTLYLQTRHGQICRKVSDKDPKEEKKENSVCSKVTAV